MGFVVSRNLGICSSIEEKSVRIVLVGLDFSGKSAILKRLQNLIEHQQNKNIEFIDKIQTEPTFVFDVQTVFAPQIPTPLNIWDLGGKTRDLWRFYLTDVEGKLYQIESPDSFQFFQFSTPFRKNIKKIDQP